MFQAAIIPSTFASAHNDRDADLISFLAGTLGEGIHLAVIGARGWIRTRNFGSDAAGAARWARRENETGGNVYWSVNRVRAGVQSKACKEDIEAIRFAHVDIDPPKDGSPWDREAAIETLFTAAVRPNFALSSGNGLQAFWRLCGAATIEQIEAVNRGLTDAFGGDVGVWNADRIMRVPGTTNWPSAKQIAAGREPREARMLWSDEDGGTTIEGLLAAFAAGDGQ